jgi:hypothetical protein
MQGAPEGTTLAPPLSSSARVLGHRDYVIKVLLHGLTGEIDGKTYSTGVMVPMGTNTDQWIADVASYVRNSFGNSAMLVTPEQVAAVRKSVKRNQPWTLPELLKTTPAPLTNTAEWKVTASHNAAAASGALGAQAGAAVPRWDTGAPQQPGMWFQIELPQAAQVSEVQIDSAATAGGGRGGRGFGPGRGGFGGRGAAPAAGPVGFTVQVSSDGTTWGAPLTQGSGQTPTTVMSFPPVSTKFIRITQTGTAVNGEWWAIQGLKVYAVGP